MPKTDAELREILEVLEAAVERKTFRRLDFFIPYPKQKEFIRLSATRREVALIAGNRNGKTECGAFAAACHLTGEYPPTWTGRRFEGPTKGWVTGETSLAVRDVCQTKLCGEPGVESRFGTGMIPREAFVDKPSLARGVTDAIDTIQVRHKPSGGVSIARFKSYEQGRSKFQGEGLDWIWFDEEPPLDIYSEGLARIGERGGIAWATFTPLKGRSAVVIRYMDEPSPDRAFVSMTIDEAEHIPPAERARIIAGYLPHEREARARGVPMLGSGRIFTTAEESILEPPLEHIPAYWAKIWGIDIGIGHPFAAALLIWDKDNDIIHVHHTIRMPDALSIVHAAAMKRVGAGVPVAWPKDAGDRHGDAAPMVTAYRGHGLTMLPEHATWPEGGYSTEAGITEWDEREKTGRIKFAAHLSEALEERRFYHRKDGQIVKLQDDILSAIRIGIMAKRFARAVALGGSLAPRRQVEMADGVDFDVHAV
jgi:phage terminase large subunit-like protein